MTLVGFKVTRVATSAATQVATAGMNYVVARLYATTACIATLHNHASATTAGSKIATLVVPAGGADEMGFPVRCDDGVRVKCSAVGELYVGIR
jgi:hypothetical protein